MTIDEAIQQLGFLKIRFREQKIIDKADAIQLGIEALKRIKKRREQPYSQSRAPLPGETEK